MVDKYCSPKFKCGEDLDAALEAALCAGDCATRAEAAAENAENAVKELEAFGPYVKTINGIAPDENGNIDIEVSTTIHAYVVGNPVSFTLSADSWDGTTYTLKAEGYGIGDDGLQIGLPPDSSTVNTQAVVEAALTLVYSKATAATDTAAAYVTMKISAVAAPTEDVTIAIFGLAVV